MPTTVDQRIARGIPGADEAIDPQIREITTSSGFPTAIVALTGPTNDEFRRYAAALKLELERLPGVDEVLAQGSEDPELHIAFYPQKLLGLVYFLASCC